MSSVLVALPVLLPLFTAVALLSITGRARLQRAMALASGALTLGVAALLAAATAQGAVAVLALGGWAPRVGVVWVVDGLSASMLVAAAVVSWAATAYAPTSLRGPREARYFHPLAQLLSMGVNGSLITGDLFNLFVFFELMLLASFALLALGAGPRGGRPAIAYVVVNLVASALFLGGVGAVYGAVGTVNLAELALRARAPSAPGVLWAASALVLVVFMLKTALAPLFFWLPDAYPEASPLVNGLFAGLLTKVGVYTLFRVVTLAGPAAPAALREALLAVAAATMLIGVIGALGRSTIRGILSFHIVSQVGYMIFGLALMSPVALAAGLLHTVHNMVAKTALVLAGGLAEEAGGSGELGRVHGLERSHPWVAAAFLVPALSLAGMPPLSGFWGKLFLVVAGFRAGAFVASAIALAVGLLTLASMLKIYGSVFWGEEMDARAPDAARARAALGATIALGVITVVLGLLAGPLFTHLERTSEMLLDTRPYIDAVLGRAR